MFNIVADISQFSLIPTSQIVKRLNFEESSPINSNFNAMGYAGTPIM